MILSPHAHDWGVVGYHARPDLLLLDLDTKRPDWGRIVGTFGTLQLDIKHWLCYPTKRGWHVVVTLYTPLPPVVLVAVQALCGSDHHRETFNLYRALRLPPGDEFTARRWQVLFSKKLGEKPCALKMNSLPRLATSWVATILRALRS